MFIYCDGSYSQGKAGIGIAVISYGVVIYKDSVKIDCRDVFDSEKEALIRAISLGIAIGAERIVSDAQYIVNAIKRRDHSRDLSYLFNLADEFDGSIDWVHREKNLIADGLSKAALRGIDWRIEISKGADMEVLPLSDPSSFSVDNEVVNKSHSIWFCSCDKSKSLRGMSLDCRHIFAVKKSLGEINQAGELIK